MQDTFKKSVSTLTLTNVLGKTLSVEQMPARNNKGGLKNHVVHHCENGTKFLSFGKLIAAMVGNQLYVSDYHDYSETTAFHCKRYTGLTMVERRNGLADGKIIHIETER